MEEDFAMNEVAWTVSNAIVGEWCVSVYVCVV